MPDIEHSDKDIIKHTENWIRNLVIKHNLCPFAHHPFHHGLIRYVVSWATAEQDIVDELINELLCLKNSDAKTIETTFLITPLCFAQFERYNDFLSIAENINEKLRLNGILQIASFHPDYLFAECPENDVRNYSNRSIYPMFHLIREASISKARKNYTDIDGIPNNNMKLLNRIGLASIQAQRAHCTQLDNQDE